MWFYNINFEYELFVKNMEPYVTVFDIVYMYLYLITVFTEVIMQ